MGLDARYLNDPPQASRTRDPSCAQDRRPTMSVLSLKEWVNRALDE